jgi:hypothetical protein
VPSKNIGPITLRALTAHHTHFYAVQRSLMQNMRVLCVPYAAILSINVTTYMKPWIITHEKQIWIDYAVVNITK